MGDYFADVTVDKQGNIHLPLPDDITVPLSNFVFRRGPRLSKNPALKKGLVGFEYAEHDFIGNWCTLTMENGSKLLAAEHKFILSNGLQVTYGQINGLAGDFYGTDQPISDGKSLSEQANRFKIAFDALDGKSSKMPDEAHTILDLLNEEVQKVAEAIETTHVDPSTVYPELPDINLALYNATLWRPSPQLNYLSLAAINWDHFGIDARVAYNAGHWVALQEAAKGNLQKAYAMDAFAVHYLEDSFSAGHIRTPRRVLHSATNKPADMCAKLMHDEESAIGLRVKDKEGKYWNMLGDKRLYDAVDLDNRDRCSSAIQISVDEVYKAYASKVSWKPEEGFHAWDIACDLDAAQENNQVLAKMFEKNGTRRVDLVGRRRNEGTKYTDDFWFPTTWFSAVTSGWWKYPITLDGPTDFAETSGEK